MLFSAYINIFNLTIILFFFVFIILSVLRGTLLQFYFKSLTYNILKNYAYRLLLINFFLITIKFLIQIFVLNNWLLISLKNTVSLKILLYYFNYLSYGIYTNNLGYGLLFLCYITAFLSLFYLGDRDLFTRGSSMHYFIFFLVCTTVMVSSSNLLIIFISFELIFMPSMYFVYALGYVKKVDKAIYFLLVWTLLGSFLVLFSFSYLYSIHSTLDYKILITRKFSLDELNYLYFFFFIGFGIKLPIFPFHYWLTKVHVEAPAGFSMFLSGFLVKTALYCFYYVNLLFCNLILKHYYIIWVCLCIVEASVKMWVQVDIKKLIAFATIQEMNMLLLCILLLNNIYNNIIVIFLIMHGILSTLMFFLVDQIQKRTQTRNIQQLSGFGLKFPIIRNYIWVMLILYLGLPLTVKFVIEWHIGALLILNLNFFGMLIFFCAIFFGSIGFIRCWLVILYGQSSILVVDLKVVDMLKKDQVFAALLVSSLFFLNFIIFLF